MKKYLVLFLAVLAGSLLANNPEQAFNQMLDTVYSGDAAGFKECLSTESVALLDMLLVMVKMKPDEAAIEISGKLGIEISEEELLSWTSTDLISAVLSSSTFISELPERHDIEVSDCATSGDSSMVSFYIGEYPETFQLLFVKSESDWKLDQGVIQSVL